MIDERVLRTLSPHSGRGEGFFGVVIGVVTNNQDSEHMHRVRVRFPWLNDGDESNWAPVISPMAGNGRGAYFLPEVGDEVLVAFEHGSVDHPYVLGAVWNGRDAPPESNQDGKNNHRTIMSRSGHTIRLNDAAGGETVEIIDKTGRNKIVIRSTDNSLSIEAQGDIAIKSVTGKVSITAATGIDVQSQAGVTLQANTTVDVKAGVQVNVQGALVKLN